MATRTLQIEIVGDPSSFSRATRRVGQDADRMGRDVERSGRRMSGFATVTTKGFGAAQVAMGGLATVGVGAAGTLAKSFVDSASDISESLSKNETLFGKFAEGVDKFSKTSATSFGISRRAALEYTGVFGNLFRSTGVAREESAKFSTDLTKLAADMASFNNTSIEDALEAIRSGLVGESEPLRRFGVNINDARLKTEALRLGLIDNTKDALEPQAKAIAAQALVFKDTKNAQGDFAKTSDGLANQQRILKARFSDTTAELGAKLLPAATSVVTAMNDLITKTRDGHGPIIAFRDAIRGTVGFVDDNQKALSGFAGAVAGLGGAFITYKLVGTVRGLAGAFVALRAAMLAHPFTAVATAIGAVAGALIAMKVAGDDAESTSRDLTDALREQEDAARAVRDIDVDLAGKRANAESAAIGVERAERRLKTVRKDGKSTALDIRQAENDVRQARVNNTRSQRDLTDAERDAKRKREDLNDSTRKLRDTSASYRRGLKNKIDSTKDDIRETGKQIDEQRSLRARFGGTSEKVDELKRKQKQLREELARLKSKKISVDVRIDFNAAFNASPGSDAAQTGGDGPGITKFIRKTIRGNANKLFNQAGGLGSIPTSIKGAAGTGLDGARAGMAPFAGIGARFGLHVGSGFRGNATTRSGNQSWHATGEAVDMFSGTNAPDANKLAYFRFMKQAFGSRLQELIYTPGGTGIWKGQPHVYTGQTAADHFDHVHVAVDLGAAGQGDGIGRGPKRRGGDGLGQFSSTAYGPPWNAMNGTGVTATGVDLRPARQAFGIAVDPSRLRLGRNYYVWPNPFARRGTFKAFDTGGAIKGNRIDFYDWRGRSTQMGWGRKSVQVSTTAIVGGGSGGGGGGSGGGSGGGGGAAPKKAGPGPRFSYGGAGGFTVARESGQVARGTAPGSAVSADPAVPSRGSQVTGYGVDVARAQRTQAVGKARNNLGTLIKGLVAEVQLKRKRLKLIRKVMRSRIKPARRKRLIEEETQLLGEIGDLAATIKEYRADAAGGATTVTQAEALDAGVAATDGGGGGGEGEPGPTQEDYLNAALAEAGLTAGTEDDRAVLGQILGLRTEELAAARASGDPRRISAAIEAWKSATEALNGVDDSAQRLTEAMTGLKDEMKRQNDIYETVIGVSSREAVKMVADIISGQIVGVGLQGRRQTAGTGATVLIP